MSQSRAWALFFWVQLKPLEAETRAVVSSGLPNAFVDFFVFAKTTSVRWKTFRGGG
jgi:hypothetical protein